MRIFKTAAFAAIFLALTSCMDRSVSPAVKTDPAIEKRIEKLLAGMTLEEKVGQMTQLTIGAKMTKTSQATALRDITDLIEKGILVAAEDGGRSSNYLLKDE